jgi:hypothetical protein
MKRLIKKPFAYNVIKIDKWNKTPPLLFLSNYFKEFRSVKGFRRPRSIKVPNDLYKALKQVVLDFYPDEDTKKTIEKQKFIFFRSVKVVEA